MQQPQQLGRIAIVDETGQIKGAYAVPDAGMKAKHILVCLGPGTLHRWEDGKPVPPPIMSADTVKAGAYVFYPPGKDMRYILSIAAAFFVPPHPISFIVRLSSLHSLTHSARCYFHALVFMFSQLLTTSIFIAKSSKVSEALIHDLM